MVGVGKTQNRETKKQPDKQTGKGRRYPMVALKRLGINAPGSSFCEGRLIEADEPIPMRLRAHLHLGEERARGTGFRVCIITREANVPLSSESELLTTNINTTLRQAMVGGICPSHPAETYCCFCNHHQVCLYIHYLL